MTTSTSQPTASPAPRRPRRAVAPVTDPTTRTAPEGESVPAAAPANEAGEGARSDAPDAPVAPPAPPAPPAPRRGRVLVAALLAVGVLAAAGGVAAGVQAQRLRSTDAARNLALVDADRTDQVVSQVSAALGQVFTYDYRSPDATSQAASRLLVGDASSQYRTLFQTLQTKAQGQQLTMTAKVQLAGVESLTTDTARLLVFLDQTSTRASDGTTATSAAQLAVGAVWRDGTWKVDQIRPE